jgi:epoxyqueuosine reductase
MQRFDARDTVRGAGLAKYIGPERAEYLRESRRRLQQERLHNNMPGFTLKDFALNAAQDVGDGMSRHFLGPQQTLTPADRGVSRWEGSPDDAARLLRVAMRHFGAASVGFVELNENTRKLIYSHDPDGKELVFSAADEAAETETTRLIPEKARWVIVYTVQMSEETLKRAPTMIAQQNTEMAYGRGLQIQNKTQEFLRGLGYQCLGEATSNALGIAPAFAVMAGLGELSRLNRVITPEYGPMVRIFKMITDLPVTPDQPIDAGIMSFCESCKKCAEACPPGALSLDDEPSWTVAGGWNNPGHRAFFENSVACKSYQEEKAGTNCAICFAVCPFAKKDKVWIHEWTRATIARAPLANSILRSLDDGFSYGAQKDPEQWWHLDLPEYGIDTGQSER